MPRFRKKPVVIEATQYAPNMAVLPEGVQEEWTGPDHTGHCTAFIETLEGRLIASPGDWIITGVKGERYACKPDIFEATYEPVDA
jgi:hypothetical protein